MPDCTCQCIRKHFVWERDIGAIWSFKLLRDLLAPFLVTNSFILITLPSSQITLMKKKGGQR